MQLKRMTEYAQVSLRVVIGVSFVLLSGLKTEGATIVYEGFDLTDRSHGQDINGSTGGGTSAGFTGSWSANTTAGAATYQSNGLAWTYRNTSVSNAPGALRSTNTVGGTATHLISRRLPAPGATTVWGSYLFRGSRLDGFSNPAGLTIDLDSRSLGQLTVEAKGYQSAATFRVDRGNSQTAESGSAWAAINTTYMVLFKALNVNQTNATVSVKMWVMTQAQYDNLIWSAPAEDIEQVLDSAALGTGSTQLTIRVRGSVALTGGAVVSWGAGDWLTLANSSTGINDVTFDEVRLTTTLNEAAGVKSRDRVVSRLTAYEGFDLDDRSDGQDINNSNGGVSSAGFTGSWSANTTPGAATYQSNGLAWTYCNTSVSNAPGALRSTNTVGGTVMHLISRRLPAPGATTVWGSYLFRGSRLNGFSNPFGLTIDPEIRDLGQLTVEAKGYQSAATFRVDRGNSQTAESGSAWAAINTTYMVLFKALNVNQTNATVSVKMWVMTQAQYNSLIINGDPDRVETRLDSAALGTGSTQLTTRVRGFVVLTGGAVVSWVAGDWLTLANSSTGINDVTLDEVRLGKTLNDVAGTLSYSKGTLIRVF